jgi:hypothetical protein
MLSGGQHQKKRRIISRVIFGLFYGRVFSQNVIKPAVDPYPLLFALTLTIGMNKCWITLNKLLLPGLLFGLSSGVQVVMG